MLPVISGRTFFENPGGGVVDQATGTVYGDLFVRDIQELGGRIVDSPKLLDTLRGHVFKSNGGGGYVDQETGIAYGQATVQAAGGTIVGGLDLRGQRESAQAAADRAAGVSQSGVPIAPLPDWAASVIAMTPAERIAREASLRAFGATPGPNGTGDEISYLAMVNGAPGNTLILNPEFVRAARTPGGVDVTRLSEGLSAQILEFQASAREAPAQVLPANVRVLVDGAEYEAPRGSAGADALLNAQPGDNVSGLSDAITLVRPRPDAMPVLIAGAGDAGGAAGAAAAANQDAAQAAQDRAPATIAGGGGVPAGVPAGTPQGAAPDVTAADIFGVQLPENAVVLVLAAVALYLVLRK